MRYFFVIIVEMRNEKSLDKHLGCNLEFCTGLCMSSDGMSGYGDGKMRVWSMLRTYYLSHAGYDVGVLCRHVIILMYIGGKVVEMGHTFLHYHLPVAHTGGLSGRSRQIPSTGIHELAALRFPLV